MIMEMTLKNLFNYQRFAQNSDLKDVIDSVNLSVSKQSLSDDDLSYVAAGGSSDISFKGSVPKAGRLHDKC